MRAVVVAVAVLLTGGVVVSEVGLAYAGLWWWWLPAVVAGVGVVLGALVRATWAKGQHR